MQIEAHTIKLLKTQLRRGDYARLVKDTGYSEPTVAAAFKGDAITPATLEILSAFAAIVEERKKEERKALAKINKAAHDTTTENR